MLEQFEVMRTEVKVDCYDGPEGDQHKKYFNVYCAGDMSDSDDCADIVIKLSDLPAGARISVTYPMCPECGLPREDCFEPKDGKWQIIGHDAECECGFDWLEWEEFEYA
jgi:hypothetical protein